MSTLHTYRCPKCGTTMQVRSRTAVVTCQASTYCATRGVVMVLEDDRDIHGKDTTDPHRCPLPPHNDPQGH